MQTWLVGAADHQPGPPLRGRLFQRGYQGGGRAGIVTMVPAGLAIAGADIVLRPLLESGAATNDIALDGEMRWHADATPPSSSDWVYAGSSSACCRVSDAGDDMSSQHPGTASAVEPYTTASESATARQVSSNGGDGDPARVRALQQQQQQQTMGGKVMAECIPDAAFSFAAAKGETAEGSAADSVDGDQLERRKTALIQLNQLIESSETAREYFTRQCANNPEIEQSMRAIDAATPVAALQAARASQAARNLAAAQL